MWTHVVVALLQVTSSPGMSPAPRTPSAVERDGGNTRRIGVTDEHLASAYASSATRELVLLARAARTRQDSALQGYDATTYQRISAWISATRFGPDRLAYRSELATRVRWRRGEGAYVRITGARALVPFGGDHSTVRMEGSISAIPYSPGGETLWIGPGALNEAVGDVQGIVHPLAEGSEAYYTYSAGDSATFRLPDGRAIRLRELRIRPREPRWNLAVGSLWFELSGGQLVRAAYRMSVPMDIGALLEEHDAHSLSDVPAVFKPMLFPITVTVSAIGIEYGLFQERFWLPRVQVLEGTAHASFMRAPFKLEQRFQYDQVNGGEERAPIVVSPETSRPTPWSVSCGGPGTITTGRLSPSDPHPVLVSVPCDSLALANSPDLPSSIFDHGDEVFESTQMDALVAGALSMDAQPGFAPRPPTLALDNARYNRIEGFAIGGHMDQILGDGYALRASARIGVASREPSVELSASRSDLRRTLTITAYNHLVSSGDWGNPFSLASSIQAFVFGQDEGFYYRASGLEVGSTSDGLASNTITWSLFSEFDRTAAQATTLSIARLVNGSLPAPNFEAARGAYYGARARLTSTHGVEQQGVRLFLDFRTEGARGKMGTYGRTALDATASSDIGSEGGQLTLAAGSSVGVLPAQRFWYLGSSQSVRGQSPGREAGDAFWLVRADVTHGLGIVRPVLFGDLGWAGDRSKWKRIGLPMSGVGAGASMIDGLVRCELARGINPERRWHLTGYVSARF